MTAENSDRFVPEAALNNTQPPTLFAWLDLPTAAARLPYGSWIHWGVNPSMLNPEVKVANPDFDAAVFQIARPRFVSDEATEAWLDQPAPVWGGDTARNWARRNGLEPYRKVVEQMANYEEPSMSHLSPRERARAYKLMGYGSQAGDPEANAFMEDTQ